MLIFILKFFSFKLIWKIYFNNKYLLIKVKYFSNISKTRSKLNSFKIKMNPARNRFEWVEKCLEDGCKNKALMVCRDHGLIV